MQRYVIADCCQRFGSSTRISIVAVGGCKVGVGTGDTRVGRPLGVPATGCQQRRSQRWNRATSPSRITALIGNLRTAALVGMDGSIDWLCLPHFDSPSVFAAILDDRKGGRFRIAPAGDHFRRKQFYWPDTAVLVTRFLHDDGVGEVEDYMPVGGTCTVPDELIRRVRVVRGRLPFRLECRPAFDYARGAHECHLDEHGARFDGPGLSLGLAAPIPLRPDGTGVVADFTLGEGEKATFVLRRLAPEDQPGRCPGVGEAEELFRDTVAYWRRWLSRSTYTGRWREMVHRSALTLKLLSFEPTGAIVAAPTCSLPESIGGPRNWDYRYTWIRDAAFTLYGLLRIGFTEEAARFRDWLKDRWQDADGQGTGPLQLMYGIDGRAELTGGDARPPGGLPRLAAGADRQRGVRAAAAGHLRRADGRRLPPQQVRRARRLRRLGAPAAAGGLGLRQLEAGGRGHLGGARRPAALRLFQGHVLGGAGPRPAAGRQAILPGGPGALAEGPRRDLRGGHGPGLGPAPPGVRSGYGSDALDASSLLMPLVFFMAPNDPRMLGTLDAIRRPLAAGGLAADGLVYRYDPAAAPDGLTGSRGDFQHVLLLAGRGAHPRRSHRPGPAGRRPAALRADARLRQPPRPVRRADRRQWRGAGQLSRRRSLTWP